MKVAPPLAVALFSEEEQTNRYQEYPKLISLGALRLSENRQADYQREAGNGLHQ